MRQVRLLVVAAISAAAFRLLPLGWLQPLNFDEIEFFRATDWVRQGLVPFRDFWEHHTPLQWYLFAPLTAFAHGDGIAPVLAMRWLQIPLWIVTFWLAMIWMRRLEIPQAARWLALAIALSSSLLMVPAIEYRVDTLGCALYLAGVLCLLSQTESRRWMLAGGVVFTLAAFANVRLAPLIVVTVLFFGAVNFQTREWRWRPGVLTTILAMVGTTCAIFAWYAARGALDEFLQQVLVENYIGDQLVKPHYLPFVQRLSIPFGLLVRDTSFVFEPAAIDPGGICILLLGLGGLLFAMRGWRRPDALFLMAVLQLASVAFIARMQRIYPYHFEIVVLLMLPFVGVLVSRIPSRMAIASLLIVWTTGAFAAIFRGKEGDRAWQDLVMREVHARSKTDEPVWDGAGWAIRRRPAYRFWFLAELPQLLVEHRYAPPYTAADMIQDPPAVIVPDYYVRWWLTADRSLGRFVTTHYLPIWRDLWVPAPNGVLNAERPAHSWMILRDGDYRLFASPRLTQHPWFRLPVTTEVTDRKDAARFPLLARRPSENPLLSWTVDGQPLAFSGGRALLRRGQRIEARYTGTAPIAVMLVPGSDLALFRQPPPGTTLEASYYRPAHAPRFSPAIEGFPLAPAQSKGGPSR
jgi:hypothetical protein